MTDQTLEVENTERRGGRLKGLNGDELYDRLHPSPAAKETARDVLAELRKRARGRGPQG